MTPPDPNRKQQRRRHPAMFWGIAFVLALLLLLAARALMVDLAQDIDPPATAGDPATEDTAY